MRKPAAMIKYKPACGGADRKSSVCPLATLTISAQSRTRLPAARNAKAVTIRSLNRGSSETRIWAINSEMSMAAQINTRVSGLSATTARIPNEVRIRVPIQLMGLGKLLRATAVRMTARHNVARLTANAQEIPSATKVGD